MNFRLFGCGKFRYLAIERFDRELKPREQDFYRKHREVCFECMRYEQQGTNAMNLLSAAAIEPEISENFDARVLSMLHKPRRRFEVAYWSPLLAGAAVAGLALIATLQLISGSGVKIWGQKQNPYVTPAFNDNRNDQLATQPSLVLPHRLTKS